MSHAGRDTPTHFALRFDFKTCVTRGWFEVRHRVKSRQGPIFFSRCSQPPCVSWSLFRSVSHHPIDHNQPASAQREKFPLFEQVPVYSARLNPGDVLINPPWWWHAINNVTPSTIGCAVRWIPEQIQDANPVFSVAQRMVPHAKEVMRVLRDPKARLTDELYRATFEPIRRER